MKRSPRSTITFGAAAVVLVVAGVVAAALLIAPREPSRADIATIETPTAVPAGGDPATARQARMSAAIAPEEAATGNAQASRTAPGEAATRKVQASRTSSVGAVPATRLAADTTPAAAPHELALSAPEPAPAGVTITGCLERHDETFRLKDTTGADAPKSRKWRSGFLKKGSASIDVVDAANGLHLTDHVGQRVSVTGLLVDREMQGRSLQRIATSCSS